MSQLANGVPGNYTIGGLQFNFWERSSTSTPTLVVDDITGQDITVAGDVTTEATIGSTVFLTGTDDGIGTGAYTVSASVFNVSDTVITVTETIPASTLNGYLSLGYGSLQTFGNIVTGSFSSDITFLDHFSSKTGTRLKDRSIVQEIAVSINLTVDEPTASLLNYFVLGSLSGTGAQRSINPYSALEREGAGRLYAVSDTGNEFYWDISRCSVKPDGEFSYNDEDWSEFSFIVDVLPNTGAPNALYGSLVHVGVGTDLTPPTFTSGP